MMTRKKREAVEIIDIDLMNAADDIDALYTYMTDLYESDKINFKDLETVSKKLFALKRVIKDAKKRVEEF